MANAIHNLIAAPSDLQLEAAAISAGPAATTRNATGAARPDPIAATGGDHATLSPLGDMLNATVKTAGTLSSFRPARVAELKRAIAGGGYNPDLGQVAQRVAQALKGAGQ